MGGKRREGCYEWGEREGRDAMSGGKEKAGML